MKHKFIYIFLLIILVTAVFIYFDNQKERVAIIGAMENEIEEIQSHLSFVKYSQKNDYQIITGQIGKNKIILAKSGVGKVSSATTTQYIIDRYHPTYIVNIGIAGSLSPDLKVGDTIIAKKMVQHDFDVTAFGCPKGYISNGIEPNKPTIFYSDKKLIDKFKKGNCVKQGTIASGDIFVMDIRLKNSIKREFGADAIDMESAAIAHTAKRNNIPVIVVRTISDGVVDKTNVYNKNKLDIAKKPAQVVIDVLKAD